MQQKGGDQPSRWSRRAGKGADHLPDSLFLLHCSVCRAFQCLSQSSFCGFPLRFSAIGLQVEAPRLLCLEADSPSRRSGPWVVNSHEQAGLNWVTCTLRVTLASSGTPEGCLFLGGCTSQLRLSNKSTANWEVQTAEIYLLTILEAGVWDQDADTPVSSGASLSGL